VRWPRPQAVFRAKYNSANAASEPTWLMIADGSAAAVVPLSRGTKRAATLPRGRGYVEQVARSRTTAADQTHGEHGRVNRRDERPGVRSVHQRRRETEDVGDRKADWNSGHAQHQLRAADAEQHQQGQPEIRRPDDQRTDRREEQTFPQQ
jgi:hypothetical protein